MIIKSLDQLDMNGSYTYADYLRWQFDERVELIKGRLLKMAAPNTQHQIISNNLSQILGRVMWRTSCKLFVAPFDVRLSHFSKTKNTEVVTVVQPDLCVICDKEKLDKKGCLGAPDLIIEILSPGNSNKEMKEKYSVYEESGVKEYWIVRPEERSAQIFRLNEAGIFIGLQPNVDGDLVTTPLFPNLEVDMRLVFED